MTALRHPLPPRPTPIHVNSAASASGRDFLRTNSPFSASNIVTQELHSVMSKTAKLAALRGRTDHDLLILIERELDRGLALANVASARSSPMYRQAETAYAKVKTLLPKIADFSDAQALSAGARLKELRLALDQVSDSSAADRKPAAWVRTAV